MVAAGIVSKREAQNMSSKSEQGCSTVENLTSGSPDIRHKSEVGVPKYKRTLEPGESESCGNANSFFKKIKSLLVNREDCP